MHDHAQHALMQGDAAVLPLALCLMGLAGGFSHCAGMCGPFVLPQTQAGLARLPVEALAGFGRLRAGLLLPYHLGRFVTYVGLGALAGGFTGAVAEATGFRWLLAAALIAAAAITLGQALEQAGVIRAPRLPGLGGLLSRRIGPLLDGPGPLGGFALGLALGFLPCGLLYAALAAASGAGGVAAGAAAMAGFVLGTVPALVVVGAAGAALGARLRRWARWVALPLLLLNAGVLLWLAAAAVA